MILPDTSAPRQVAEARAALRQAEEQLETARTARHEHEAAVKEAESLDRAALADRLAHDPEARPSREHRDRAETELAEAEEIEQACAANLEAASERAVDAVFERLTDWQEGIERARRKSDSSFEKALSRLQEAEAERAALRGVDAWIRQLRHGGRSWLVGGGTVTASRGAQALPGRLGVKDPHNADAKLSVAYALELLAQYGETTSVEGERRAEQERAERERQAEEHQRRVQEMHRSAIQPR